MDVRLEAAAYQQGTTLKQVASPLSSLIVAKGQATPSPAVANTEPQSASKEVRAGASTHSRISASTYFKSLTLKLDVERYKALKLAGLERNQTSQEILVQALDAWLVAHAQHVETAK